MTCCGIERNQAIRSNRRALLAGLLGLAGLLAGGLNAGSAKAGNVDLKLMTFNIRFDDGSFASRFGANGWYPPVGTDGARKDRAVAVITDNAPDILGTEEVLPNQLADLQAALPGYGYHGLGRNGGNSGEHSGIFYLASRFTPLAQGDFWLSTTPTVPGTTFVGGGSDTGNPRMASWLTLQDNQSHQSYFVLNTHWSLDSQARNLSANLIRSQIDQLSGGLPVIVLGDFNTTLTSTALETLTGANNSGFKLNDAYRQANPVVNVNEATYHNFTGSVGGPSIDHIFATPGVFTATSATIVRTRYGGKYPSDHYPVVATLQVAIVPEPASAALFATGIVTIGLFYRRKRLSGVAF